MGECEALGRGGVRHLLTMAKGFRVACGLQLPWPRRRRLVCTDYLRFFCFAWAPPDTAGLTDDCPLFRRASERWLGSAVRAAANGSLQRSAAKQRQSMEVQGRVASGASRGGAAAAAPLTAATPRLHRDQGRICGVLRRVAACVARLRSAAVFPLSFHAVNQGAAGLGRLSEPWAAGLASGVAADAMDATDGIETGRHGWH